MRYGPLFILPLVAFIAVIGVIIWRFLKNIRKVNNKAIIAHTSPIRALPEYKQALLIYRIMLGVTVAVFISCYAVATIVASRPYTPTMEETEYSSHDVMLCLDVSGSMNQYIPKIVDYFNDISANLKGQRVGITIFDSHAVSIMPLSNDYMTLVEVTEDLRDNTSNYRYIASDGGGSSKIGNGLIGCVNNFDKIADEERTRAIILATDNLGADIDSETASLWQAGEYAKRFDIRVYGIDVNGNPVNEENRLKRDTFIVGSLEYEHSSREFRDVTINTNGLYYTLVKPDNFNSDDNSINTGNYNPDPKAIVSNIMQQDASLSRTTTTRTTRIDSPNGFIIALCVLTVTILLLIWRLRV